MDALDFNGSLRMKASPITSVQSPKRCILLQRPPAAKLSRASLCLLIPEGREALFFVP